MKREVIAWTDEATWLAARSKDITSTTVGALFGCSPYLTHFELWNRHHGEGDFEVEPFENERTIWGQRLQDSIARGVAQEHGWGIRKMPEYVRYPDARIGSSFDFRRNRGGWYESPGVGFVVETTFADSSEDEIIECKNVDSLMFKRGWAETDFGLEAPAAIELQVQHQLLVSGLKRAYIAALVGGNRLVLLEREYDEAIGTRILEACEAFWKSKTAPEPDFSRDAEFISRLYVQSGAGKTIDADKNVTDMLRAYNGLGESMRAVEKAREAMKAELLTLVGDAERIEFDGGYALARTVKETVVESFTRKASRPLRIYERKS